MRFSLFVLLIIFSGCSYYMPNPDVPPPPSAKRPITLAYSCTNPTVPPVIPDGLDALTLADLVDVGLQNSPKTRAAWYQAKQAATEVGTARGAYLPSVMLQGFWLKQQLPTPGVINDVIIFREKILGFTVATNYLLFDFGGRNGNLLSALWALDSLKWNYNWEVQTVMINVIQSYYNYIYALALIAADEATVEDNLTTVEATASRRIAGASAISDELQARTSLIQSQITLEQDRGSLNIARATLVQSLGLPPDSPVCVAGLPETIAAEGVCHDMANILQAAKEHRADLQSMRAQVLQARFQIRTAKSALLPTFTTNLLGGKESINGSRYLDTYLLQFNINVPIFSSFSDINALRQAQAALLEAQANLDDQELTAFLAALSDYYELVANQQILKYSYAYLNVAEENRKAAFANYKAGVTTIIDLMTANNALNTARKQLIDAKANFLTSLANLAYDTGSLTVKDLCLGPCRYPPWTEKVETCDEK